MDTNKIEELNTATIKNNMAFEQNMISNYKLSIMASVATMGIAAMINSELVNHVATIGKAPIEVVANIGAAGFYATAALVVGVPVLGAAIALTSEMIKLGGSAIKIISNSMATDKQAVSNLALESKLESRMSVFRQKNPAQTAEENTLEVSRGPKPF